MIRRRLLRAAGAAATLGASRALRAQTPPPQVLWFTVEGAKGVRALGERFTAGTGVPLVVRL